MGEEIIICLLLKMGDYNGKKLLEDTPSPGKFREQAKNNQLVSVTTQLK